MKSEAFVLLGPCVPVRGAERSVICDLQHRRTRAIPDELYEVLESHSFIRPALLSSSGWLMRNCDLRTHLAALVEEGYGCWTDEPERFRAMESKPDRALLAQLEELA